jgi:hypothetical protein
LAVQFHKNLGLFHSRCPFFCIIFLLHQSLIFLLWEIILLPAISISVLPLFFYFLAYFNKWSIYPFWFHSNHMSQPFFLLLISAMKIFYNYLGSWFVLRMLVQLPVTFYLYIRIEKEFIWPIFVIRCMMNHASGITFSFSCNQT